ncbi:MAG: transcriptional repressor LexA [Bacteroidota bacterium]|nr:transcriptional repressor LexA [Candidatus Kapabacteria bacterium]MDW8220966.1 transcriptional repressor LexA [Bacteroidota bacterium]
MVEVVGFHPDNAYVQVPLYMWSVHAGKPIQADDTVESTMRVPADLIPHPKNCYLLRVIGNSMERAHILDGDLIIVDHTAEPRHNSIVVASVNGEMTVKRLFAVGNRTMLLPENPAFQPIIIREFDTLVIHGVVIGVFRNVQ